MEQKIKRTISRFDLFGELSSIYKKVILFIVPINALFLVFESLGYYEIFYVHRLLLLYILIVLLAIYGIIALKVKREYLEWAHHVLLFGVMLINLIWFYYDPGYDFNLNFLIALNLIGIVLVRPLPTMIFFIVSLTLYLAIGIFNDGFELKLFFLGLCSALIVSLFNRWRYVLLVSLQNARRTYQDFFDSSDSQKYVLTKDFEILDLSRTAEQYLQENGVNEPINKKFQEVFIAETNDCKLSFNEAIEECERLGNAHFYANCSIVGSTNYVPKEFSIKKTKYFNRDAFVMDVRFNIEKKELLDHKDNVTQILENISSFVFNISYDIKDRFKHQVNFVSTKVEEIFGYSVDEYISLVKSDKLYKDVHPDDVDHINEKFEKLLKKGGKDTWRYRMLIRQEWRWIEEKLIVRRSDDGLTASLLGLIKDVTDEVVSEEQLKESEFRYRQIFNSTLAGVYRTNVNGKILDCNPAFAKILGYNSPEEVKRLNVTDVYFNIEDRTEYIEKLEQEKELNNYIIRLKDKKGQEVIVSNNVALIASEKSEDQIILGTMIDITEQYQFEREILESRSSFKNIIDHSPASIFLFTNDELVFVNPKAEKLLKTHLKSTSGQLYKIFPEKLHALIKDLTREAENEISSYTEIELSSDEEIKRFSITVVKTNYLGKPSYLFILLDISLQTEYNSQKLRAEIAEETNILLQEEIKRHKKTQKSLEESTSRLRALFQTTSNLYMLSIDRDYNLVSFNDKFAALTSDYLNKEVELGDNFLDIFPITDFAYGKIETKFQEVFNGSPTNLISHFDSNFGEVWMESFLSPIIIPGEEIKEISFISHDITEQVLNRRKILDSEENNRAILRAVPDLIFKVNKKGVFTDYRPSSESNKEAFERLINTEDIIGKNISEILSDKIVASEIKEHINEALKIEKVIIQNFSISYENEAESKVHYENRYVKINEDEVLIISRNVTDTVEYEHKLIESVKEKEVLLKEVHHRVKNNLQVINSILNLQSSYVKDEETLQIIIESQNRIRSMSYIHESLYQTKDFSSINFYDYITNLVQNLVHSYDVSNERTTLDLEVDQVNLALDQAIPCGLILNELITNALKYAYPGEKKGKITIAVWEEVGKVFLKVKDYGVGLPPGFKIDESESLGLSLVDTLIDQIDGELILKTDSGTEFLIIFDKQEI
ncbi:MAG: PAS domain S-box protein [Crocinitomicaceae bacterium]